MKRYLLSGAILFIAMNVCGQQRGAFAGHYPDTRVGNQVDTFFGTTVADPYRWLEDDRSAETGQWVQAENGVTDGYLAQIPFREAIKQRLTALWNYEKFSAPVHEGDYLYFYKNNGLQNQSVVYRQKGNGEPEVFLDPNTFSKDGTVSLSDYSFSKDGSMVAYQTSDGGSDWTKAVVMKAVSKEMVGDTMRNLKFSGIAWKGNTGFYYSTYDVPTGSQLSAKTEHHKLMWHKLGTPQSADVLVFGGEGTPRRYIGGYLTEDERYLIITAANATYGE